MIRSRAIIIRNIFLNPEKINAVISLIKTNNFNNLSHCYIFEAIKQLKKQNHDIVHLKN
ncbi:hypothetical protein J8J04_02970 ['Fragaria x ananassa' phyllody phytoplasma]|uniref:DNA helicase DnaB-like N-terminal domain-containing protein n=1 Tax='Fragaria x ananassa' phyllody phytoplasma TaxID=2358428 RepID=A0ABS5K5V5_9MOLU|nr:hypothetical protein ['Fragaria x ananassa' phyllody phytoplasma]